MKKYDVIVVGAGHAGIEAASVSAKLGTNTLLFVIKMESIGRMSCNPSIGGPAKGHLAREIDAMGGILAEAADTTGIQFRMLNRKKGPAVWAPRSQNDRTQYTDFMRIKLESQQNLDIIEAMITDLIIEESKIIGVRSEIGKEYFAPKVILANGTFLKGLVHVGNTNIKAGRAGEPSSEHLSSSLKKAGFRLERFKTGTPPRIDIRTVDFSQLEEQPGDSNPSGFSYYKNIPLNNSVSCYLTFTSKKTHQIVKENLHQSSLYGGNISGTGPRYCPSIEDKIVKFSEKEKHQVFIEPEGINTFEAYVNGISNSLPPDIQEDMVHSIPGLENSILMRYAYAIEYDYIVPDQLKPTLETKLIKGLYLCGQINGTSGYEEAGAQGLVAGINAVFSLSQKDPIFFDRSQSYIGVLIDDLVTKGTSEPYRLFTSRAEYRLYLRQDNADQRLMPLAKKLGTLSDTIWQKFQKNQYIFNREMHYLSNHNCINHHSLKEPVRFTKLMKRPEMTFSKLKDFGYHPAPDVTPEILSKISLEIKYEGYLKRQLAEIERFEKMEHTQIPAAVNYFDIQSIAYEAREKLQNIRPISLGQASRISGVNQTDVSALLIYLKKNYGNKNS